MPEIASNQLIEQLRWRYAVKRFDARRKIDDETWSALEQALILTPSSYGLQPWKFIVITDQKLKDQLPEISWNQKQPQDCSHMVVLAGRKVVDTAYIDRYMESVVVTRQLAAEAMDGYRNTLVRIVEQIPNHLDWNARQVYIALGQLMVAAAMLGVDTCPMEGIDTAAYDKILGLENAEFTTVVGCAVGFRHRDDAQANAAKVRFDQGDLIEYR